MKNEFKKYTVTLKHDEGKINIIVVAKNKKMAMEKVMKSENCPQRAIIKIKVG